MHSVLSQALDAVAMYMSMRSGLLKEIFPFFLDEQVNAQLRNVRLHAEGILDQPARSTGRKRAPTSA
jgi:hypothetical protein